MQKWKVVRLTSKICWRPNLSDVFENDGDTSAERNYNRTKGDIERKLQNNILEAETIQQFM